MLQRCLSPTREGGRLGIPWGSQTTTFHVRPVAAGVGIVPTAETRRDKSASSGMTPSGDFLAEKYLASRKKPASMKGGFGPPPMQKLTNGTRASNHGNTKSLSNFRNGSSNNDKCPKRDKPFYPRSSAPECQQATAAEPGGPQRNHIVKHSKPRGTIPLDDFRMAVMRGGGDVIKDYLAQGLPVDVVFASGWTALMYAANCNQHPILELLLNAGADPNFHKDLFTVLMAACTSTKGSEPNILQCVGLLLDKEADVNAYDRYHMSALIYASREGRASVAGRLVEAGANINKQDNKGYTGLMWAVSRGHVRAVQVLLQAGADVSKQGVDGSRASDLAALQQNQQVKLLIQQTPPASGNLPPQPVSIPDSLQSEEDAAVSSVITTSSSSSTSISQSVLRYGDLELFLSGLELGDLIPLFQQQLVEFSGLLRMNDLDLQRLGIQQLGTRKKLLDAIRDTHTKEWQSSSLPALQYNKRINCSEAVAMVANIKKHATYVASTVGYIGDQIRADRDLLINAQDGAGVEELCIETEEAVTNVRLLYEELVILRTHMNQVTKREEFRPPDLIDCPLYHTRRRRRRSLAFTVIGISLIGLCVWKRDAISSLSSEYLGWTFSRNS